MNDAPPPPRTAAWVGQQLASLVAQRDWAEACALLRPGLPRGATIVALAQGIDAALAAGDEAVLEGCVTAAIAREMPHRPRAGMALALARGGRADMALAMLAADPGTIWNVATRRLATTVLAVIVLDRRAPPVARAAAQALRRRLSRAGEPPVVRAPFDVAHPAPPPPVAFPTRVRLAPGTDAGFDAEIAGLVAQCADAKALAPVEVLENVFINADGHIWRADGQVLSESGGLPPEAAAAMSLAPRIAAGVFAVGATNNLYHWFGSWLPRMAWRGAQGVPAGLPVLLRHDAHRYQTEGLHLAYGADLPVLPVGGAVQVGTLYRSSGLGVRYDPNSLYEPLLARMIAAAEATAPIPNDASARLYISRRDSAQRSLGNEVELEAALAARGFVAVTMSGRSLAEQIRLVRAASVVVSPHGAGLTLLLFARPGTTVFELIPALPRTMTVRLCMTAISRARGHRHMAWIEPCNEVTGQWSCAIPELLPALETFIAGG